MAHSQCPWDQTEGRGRLAVAADTGFRAPGLVSGDRILANLAAYDLGAPYSRHRLTRLADPAPGDMVLIRLVGDRIAVKRVIAGPGTEIVLRDNHVTIDGVALEYVGVAPQETAAISRRRLGPVVSAIPRHR